MSVISLTIKWGLISLILIMLIHYIFYYLKNTLTTPKIKDLIDEPNKTYLEMQHAHAHTHTHTQQTNENENNMKNELNDFLKELSKKGTSTTLTNLEEQYASY